LERLSFSRLSTRLNNIIRASQTEIRNNINDARTGGRAWVEWDDGEMFIPRSVLAQTRNNWEAIRQNLNRVNEWITFYEIREATSLLNSLFGKQT